MISRNFFMSDIAHASAIQPVPFLSGEILPWLAFDSDLSFLMVYFIGAARDLADTRPLRA